MIFFLHQDWLSDPSGEVELPVPLLLLVGNHYLFGGSKTKEEEDGGEGGNSFDPYLSSFEGQRAIRTTYIYRLGRDLTFG